MSPVGGQACFAGIWLAKDAGWVVYHFGRTNIQLNESGEFNARILAQEKFQGQTNPNDLPMLILSDSTDTALAILRYSEWFWTKKEGQRGHLKNIHYHIPMGRWLADFTYFLPIVCYDWQKTLVKSYFTDIADRVEIWVQVVPQEIIWNWYQGEKITLPYCQYRLPPADVCDNLSRA